jgi:hypothetical protein
MPTQLEVNQANAIISIAQSLKSISNELIQLNQKLEKLTYRDALAVVDLTKV